MTEKEAIETKLVMCEICRENGKPTEAACNNCSDKVAIEALEKQIKEKPINDGWTFRCKKCGFPVLHEFCNRCGQAIDWSEVEQ